jgi:hypothetical protein
MTAPSRGFISYARENRLMLEAFRPHLAALKLSHGIEFWADPQIPAGSDWEEQIRQQIARSDWFMLLLTPAFIASSFIMEDELPAIRERRKTTHGLVLPVVLLGCAWDLVAAELQAVPTDGKGRLKPIADWKPRSNGYDQARRQICAAVDHYYGAATAAAGAVPGATRPPLRAGSAGRP